jgi:hypothetical protein
VKLYKIAGEIVQNNRWNFTTVLYCSQFHFADNINIWVLQITRNFLMSWTTISFSKRRHWVLLIVELYCFLCSDFLLKNWFNISNWLEVQDTSILALYTVSTGEQLPTFRKNVLPPSTRSSSSRRAAVPEKQPYTYVGGTTKQRWVHQPQREHLVCFSDVWNLHGKNTALQRRCAIPFVQFLTAAMILWAIKQWASRVDWLSLLVSYRALSILPN